MTINVRTLIDQFKDEGYVPELAVAMAKEELVKLKKTLAKSRVKAAIALEKKPAPVGPGTSMHVAGQDSGQLTKKPI